MESVVNGVTVDWVAECDINGFNDWRLSSQTLVFSTVGAACFFRFRAIFTGKIGVGFSVEPAAQS